MSQRTEIFNRVTDRIVAALEKAQADMDAGLPWSMPWVQQGAAGAPQSVRGRPYRGINFAILSMLRGVYPSQLFGTYKAWQEKGAQVRKGEKGIPVIFWKFLTVADQATGEDKDIAFARGYTVFAAEQVDGFDLAAHQADAIAKLPHVAERLEHAETVMAAYATREAIQVSHGGAQAFYRPSTDSVQMPLREAFKSTAGYYSTLAHELAHSTGAEKRLDRNFSKSTRFGDHAYAVEELVAELSAAMTCAALNIETETRVDHARYIASWLKALKADARAIITASSAAQKASDRVLGDAATTNEEEND